MLQISYSYAHNFLLLLFNVGVYTHERKYLKELDFENKTYSDTFLIIINEYLIVEWIVNLNV